MAVSDLDPAELAAELGDRPVRSYPALLSTEPVAMAWARQGAPSGALVVADYQASPRGRAGMPWVVVQGRGLGFTLLLRPELPAEREGWPYVTSLLALRDVVDPEDAGLVWPDTLRSSGGDLLARVGVHVELAASHAAWLTVTVLVEQAPAPRGRLLAQLASALERRMAAPAEQVLADYLAHCVTIGEQRRARLIPLGPGGPEVTGQAVDVLADGALVLRTARGARVAVPPHDLGLLEEPAGPTRPPEPLLGQRS